MKRHPLATTVAPRPGHGPGRPLAAAAALAAALLLPLPARADVLTGGLLGSVFRGDPFTGPRVIDLVVLGLVIFLVLRAILGRQRPGGDKNAGGGDIAGAGGRAASPYTRDPAPGDRGDDAPPRAKPDMYSNAAAMWSYLQTKPSGDAAPATGAPPAAPGSDDEFLAGAKLAYPRIRQAMAKRDFDDLAGFVAPELLAGLRQRLPLSPPPEPDILIVEAHITDKRQETGHTVISVDYDVLIHEENAPHNTDRRERWVFSRDDGTPGSHWLLTDMRPGGK
jgi:predicted lipid-binding transport protein (Tim44 family)